MGDFLHCAGQQIRSADWPGSCCLGGSPHHYCLAVPRWGSAGHSDLEELLASALVFARAAGPASAAAAGWRCDSAPRTGMSFPRSTRARSTLHRIGIAVSYPLFLLILLLTAIIHLCRLRQFRQHIEIRKHVVVLKHRNIFL